MTPPRLWRWTVWLFLTLTLGATTALVGQALGALPAPDDTWLRVLIVGVGGFISVVALRTYQEVKGMRQLLLGYNNEDGLLTTVRELGITVEGLTAMLEGIKRWMPGQDEHRATLNQSVSRLDREMRDVQETQRRLVAWAEEVGPGVGRPFVYPPDADFHLRRERDAG